MIPCLQQLPGSLRCTNGHFYILRFTLHKLASDAEPSILLPLVTGQPIRHPLRAPPGKKGSRLCQR